MRKLFFKHYYMGKIHNLILISTTLALALTMPKNVLALSQTQRTVKIKLPLPKAAIWKHSAKRTHSRQSQTRDILKSAGDGRELWANIVYQKSWNGDDRSGVYSFDVAPPMTMAWKGGEGIEANGGSALVGDILYVMEENRDTGIPKLADNTV